MKKTLSLILALTLICSVFYACGTVGSVGLEYEVNPDGKTCTITGIGTFTGTDLVIPNKIDGYSVTSIGDEAFFECSGISSITIPDSVTSIGVVAFYGCSGLTSITIPDSVKRIGDIAFSNTAFYNNSDNWSGGVLYIGNHLIEAKSDTISVDYTVKEGTKCIADSAFSNCRNLTRITIPDSVTSIGTSAFFGCSLLTSITIPDSVTSIGTQAFFGCSWLTSITIPDSVTRIGDSAFSGCSGLTSITVDVQNTVYHSAGNCIIATESKKLIAGCQNSVIPGDGSVTNIGDYAFSGCSRLTSITIPDSVTSIGYNAFGGCSGLTRITIPDSVTSIGEWAFSGCSGLTSITIPDSVTSIGEGAFALCSSPTSITVDADNTVYHSAGNCIIETESKTLIAGCQNSVIPDDDSVTSIGDYAFYGCSGLTSITIPDSVTSIGDDAFYYCSELTSITIHDSVTSIGDDAFSGCSGLTNITFNGTMEQWDSISKGDGWNYSTGEYTIHCTNGDINK